MKWFLLVIIALVTVSALADLNKSKLRGIQDRIGFSGKSHKKRGVLGSIPTFSKGYDFPIVKHSILKPFVVDFPLRSVPVGLKIPLKPPNDHVKYPVPVGHSPPVPYPGYGLKIPSVQSPSHIHPAHIHPTVVKSEWPVKCAPNIPEAPTVTKTVVTAPAAPLVPTSTLHVAPAFIHPPPPVFHAPAPLAPIVPLSQPPVPLFTKPLIPVHTQLIATAPAPAPLPAILRPGNSVQSSFFGTFPKHPIVNTAHIAPLVPIHHQPLVPVKAHPFPIAPHFNVPINIAPSSVGIIPSGPHFPVHQAINPQFINVAHPSKTPVGVLPGEEQFPVNQIPLQDAHPSIFPHAPITPTSPISPISPLSPMSPLSPISPISPTHNIPFGMPNPFVPQSPLIPTFGPSPSPSPDGIFPTAPTPTIFPTVSDFPAAVGPSPTNIPLGVGQIPLEDNIPFINNPNIQPGVGPTIIPTADSGIFPNVQQDENVDSVGNGVNPIDANPWMPMNPPVSIPHPTPPQFVPEDEPKFAPTDNTNFNNQGYHYRPNSNIPFEEINERYRIEEQQQIRNRQNEYRNHFSLRQHLPLRRPPGNFARYP